jgi:hypothetical protein
MNTVLNFIRSTETLNFDVFSDLIDERCVITYRFNDSKSIVNDKNEYVNKLKNGHFNNTTKVEVVSLNCHTLLCDSGECEGLFSVEERANFTRLGYGRDESGPGVYHMNSKGTLNIKDGKILDMEWTFSKKLLNK